MFTEEIENPKLRKDNRVLILKPSAEGALDSAGRPDKRLFNGENNIHLIREKNNLWRVAYDKGTVPPALTQKFTSFEAGYAFVKLYFSKRGVDVVGVID